LIYIFRQQFPSRVLDKVTHRARLLWMMQCQPLLEGSVCFYIILHLVNVSISISFWSK
jgi:hypothetical protein